MNAGMPLFLTVHRDSPALARTCASFGPLDRPSAENHPRERLYSRLRFVYRVITVSHASARNSS